MGDTVEFTEEAVKAYIDHAIGYWRGRRDEADRRRDVDTSRMSSCYVDAFQSMRTSLFGETLPPLPKR